MVLMSPCHCLILLALCDLGVPFYFFLQPKEAEGILNPPSGPAVASSWDLSPEYFGPENFGPRTEIFIGKMVPQSPFFR